MIFRGGIPGPIGEFPGSVESTDLIRVGRLGVLHSPQLLRCATLTVIALALLDNRQPNLSRNDPSREIGRAPARRMGERDRERKRVTRKNKRDVNIINRNICLN